MLIDKLLYVLTARLPARLIKLDTGPYLERYYVGTLFGVTFYLHRFVSSDTERHLHNHPWTWARALVLSGGYLEESVVDICPHAGPDGVITKKTRVRFWNTVNGNLFHRISEAKPGTWTLFFHGERQQVDTGHYLTPKGWGFLERTYLVGVHDAVVFRPFPSASTEWWKTAEMKTGATIGRAPLKV